MRLFNYLPITMMLFGLFMVFPSFVVKNGKVYCICNYELSYFPSVTSSYGEDVLTVLVRN